MASLTATASTTIPTTTGDVGRKSISPVDNLEATQLAQLKNELGTHLTEGRHSSYPEVVGDINLLRHLRGLGSVKEAKKKFLSGLEARETYALDDIRDEYAHQFYTTLQDGPEKELHFEKNIWTWRNELLPGFYDGCGGMGGSAYPDRAFPRSSLSGHLYSCISIADWQPGSKDLPGSLLSTVTPESFRRQVRSSLSFSLLFLFLYL